jgi:hypothetical protein
MELETLLEMDPGNQKSIGYLTPVCMVTPSHLDLPEGGGYQTREHLKDLCFTISISNSEIGQKEILVICLFWHSDMELENLLDPGSQKVLDMETPVCMVTQSGLGEWRWMSVLYECNYECM